MDQTQSESQSSLEIYQHNLRELALGFRILVIPISVASLWIMTSKNLSGGTSVILEIINLSLFKSLMSITSISLGYAMASILLSSLIRSVYIDCLLFILDEVVALLMSRSGYAVYDLLNQKVLWSAGVCSLQGSFCRWMNVSLFLNDAVYYCYMGSLVTSIVRVWAKLKPPAFSQKSRVDKT